MCIISTYVHPLTTHTVFMSHTWCEYEPMPPATNLPDINACQCLLVTVWEGSPLSLGPKNANCVFQVTCPCSAKLGWPSWGDHNIEAIFIFLENLQQSELIPLILQHDLLYFIHRGGGQFDIYMHKHYFDLVIFIIYSFIWKYLAKWALILY